ncbi:MAG: SDR family oxidoreductase [Desulfuromonadales bacterium]|nr:SDR family oxidoreductase [Desulfuromonadales bacterium]
MKKIVIAGCGYIGSRVARLWQDQGAEVLCLVRSPEKAAILAGDGYAARAVSLDDPAAISLPELAGAVLYYLVPPPGGGIVDTRARNFIEAIKNSGRPAKIIYMSATSVYSETGGGPVTEKSPVEPQTSMGKRRLDAERAFLGYGEAAGVPVIILRVSGIYGPGRLPLMQVSQSQPLLREEESGPSNRIHADDLAAVCLAAADRGQAGEIFNVSDGHPSSMTGYFNACADLLGYPRQPQVTLAEARQVMSPLMLSYVTESRVVDSSRMLERLNITLKYPTMREGLPACR